MRYVRKFESDPRDNFDRLKEALDEGLYKCTSCGKCLAVCPKNINTFGDAIERMRAIAVANGSGPLPEHVVFKENILESGRSIKTDKPSFIEEAENETGSKVAFFTGCMVDYKFPEIGHKLVKILKENGYVVEEKDKIDSSSIGFLLDNLKAYVLDDEFNFFLCKSKELAIKGNDTNRADIFSALEHLCRDAHYVQDSSKCIASAELAIEIASQGNEEIVFCKQRIKTFEELISRNRAGE